MNYEKIVNIPLHNPVKANEMLNDLIYNQIYYLFFVFGESNKSDKLLELNSKMAEKKSDPILVVFISDYKIVEAVLKKMKDKTNTINDFSKVLWFATSIMDEIIDVIFTDEEFDIIRIWKAMPPQIIN